VQGAVVASEVSLSSNCVTWQEQSLNLFSTH
jgi:hypothetical protein